MDVAQIVVEGTAGLAALVLFYMRIRLEKEIARQQATTREFEAANRAQELELRRQEVAITREKEEIASKALRSQLSQFQFHGVALAKAIASELTQHTNWAVQALEEAKLHPSSDALISGRMKHYPSEKEYLGARFTPVIMNRCRWFVEENYRVVLIVDSGSTLLPMIKHICDYINDRRSDAWLVSRQLVIYTNSLAGSNVFMQSTSATIDDHADLAVDFHVLPGIPLPTFSGVGGIDTTNALDVIRDAQEKESGKRVKILALLTGNWVHLPRHRCPVPLARGTDHLTFKKDVARIADEVYVIAPLGKIFYGQTVEQINAELRRVGHSGVGQRQSYQSLIPDLAAAHNLEIAGKMRLVTTYRPDDTGRDYLLAKLSERISESMDDPESPVPVTKDPSEDAIAHVDLPNVANLSFKFTDVGLTLQEQLPTEFPHLDTREERFVSTCFSVPAPFCRRCF